MLFSTILPVTHADVILIPAGAPWKYFANGLSPNGWPSVVNDDAWASGPAELGYNTDNSEPPEATVIPYGGNANAKYITYYFRHSFTVADPAAFVNGLKLRMVRDDGAVVYLNGTELVRSNMPTGAITPNTLSSTAVGGTDESKFFEFPLGNSLIPGNNVIAVEVHQQAANSSDVSFNLELIGLDGAPTLTRGPYLQNAATTPPDITSPGVSAISIRWRTSFPTTSKVWWGTTPELSMESAPIPGQTPTTEHEIRIPELLPNQQYFYAVGTAQGMLASGPDYLFNTPPVPGSTQPFRVWVLGDSGTANANAAAVRNAYAAFNGTNYTNMWLMLGDNAYNNGTDAEFQAAVFNMYPAMLRQSPLWSTLGNHDHYTSSGAAYFNLHTFPTAGEAGGAPSGTEKYYSFDYGNVHFICLDSMSSDRTPGGPMAVWLQNDLQSTMQDWIVAFWHHPPYTFGSHNSDNVNNLDGELVQMRENFLPLLEAGGVDLVMGGHSHSYERSYFMDGHYGQSNTFLPSMKKAPGDGREVDNVGAYAKPKGLNANQGAVYATAGSSGKATNWWGGSTALVNPNPHPAMVVSLLKLGSMVLDFNNNRLDVKFVNSTGGIDDQFTIKKTVPNLLPAVAISSPLANSTVDAPVTITATAGDSDGTIARVDFYAGSNRIGSSESGINGRFEIGWNGAPYGKQTLTAEAWDNLGAYTVSAPVEVTVTQPPNVVPTVQFTSPVDESTFNAPETVTLSGTAADSDGSIVSVSIKDETVTIGNAVFASGSWTFSWSPSPGNYNLTAVAVDDRGGSATSPQVRIYVKPAPPVNLTAVAGDRQVSLSWTASSGANSYNVKRATASNGPFASVAPGLTSTGHIDDLALVNGTTYFYVVTSSGVSGESADSLVVSATPTPPNVAPTVAFTSPAGGSTFNAPATVTLSGTAADSDGNIVSVSIKDETVTIGNAVFASGSWTFSWSPSPKDYNLTAEAVDDRGGIATSTPLRITVKPAPPDNLTAAGGDGEVSLSWTASSGATSYSVKRATGSNGPFAPVGLPLTTTGYTDMSLLNGTTYFYVVTATATSGESENSLIVSATPSAPVVLSAPTNLRAKAISRTQIDLTWAEASSNESGFKIERSLSSSSSTFTEIGIAEPNATTYQDLAGIKANTTYYYRVRAYAGDSNSGYSNTRSIKTPR